jgi:hypothetical protein
MTAALCLALFAVLLFLCCVTIGVIKELQTARRRVHLSETERAGVLFGSPLPPFKWTDVWTGESIKDTHFKGKGSIITFISSFCPTCREVPHTLAAALSARNDMRLVVVCSGDEDDCKFVCQKLKGRANLVCDGAASATDFRISNFPTSVIVDETATLRAGTRSLDPQVLLSLFSEAMSETVGSV